MNAHVDCILSNVCAFLDFHRVTHHDSCVNKTPINIFYEFMYFQVLIILVLVLLYFYNSKVNKRHEANENSKRDIINNSKIKKDLLIRNIKKLLNIWEFEEINKNSCNVIFFIDIELKNPIVNILLNKFSFN